MEGGAEDGSVFAFAELGGGAGRGPLLVEDRVVVEGEGIHAVSDLLHHDAGPVVVGDVGAAGDALDAFGAVVTDEGVIATIEVGVIFGAHVAAASPAFVSDTEVLEFPGVLAAVFATEVGHGGFGR